MEQKNIQCNHAKETLLRFLYSKYVRRTFLPRKIDTFWHNWIIKITLDTSDLLGLSVGCIERPWAADCGQMEKL